MEEVLKLKCMFLLPINNVQLRKEQTFTSLNVVVIGTIFVYLLLLYLLGVLYKSTSDKNFAFE